MRHDAVKYNAAEEAVRRSFERGLYGSNEYNTAFIMSKLSGLKLFESAEQPTFELHDAPKGQQMLVMTMDDGTRQHMTLNPSQWIKGPPRPTEPGVYQHPDKPTYIYTLYSDGSWRSNQNFNGTITERYVPDGLIKIA